ncbi:hypothetical protein MRB53_003162 [Persea americana]|uniref:Uncharacterized protein n=1 Tax=Persea americana TaxID=3435 RepID=A0ACC2MWU2_PERAE|nr:hypothetical protein MRB53_003162 [Persea americana]
MVIGHECAGIIEEVGSEVKHLVVGDRVALEPGIICSRCNICKDGRYNLCRDMKFFASPPFHGSLANQLPENVSLEEGAMCEPLSVGIHSCRRANVGPETNVLIVGAGPTGLVMMLAARAFRAPRIIIVDVDDYRLSVAKDLGADQFVNVSTSIQDVDAEVGEIQKAMGVQVDVAFDCVGFGKTMSTALNATRAGGKVCLVGMGHSEMTVPLTPAAARYFVSHHLLDKEITGSCIMADVEFDLPSSCRHVSLYDHGLWQFQKHHRLEDCNILRSVVRKLQING